MMCSQVRIYQTITDDRLVDNLSKGSSDASQDILLQSFRLWHGSNKFWDVLMEMVFLRYVDAFEVYIKDIICEIILKEPRAALSLGNVCHQDGLVDFTELCDLENIEDARKASVVKRVEAMSFKGFNSVFEILNKFKLTKNISPDDIALITSSIKLRNEIVHRNSAHRRQELDFSAGINKIVEMFGSWPDFFIFIRVVESIDAAAMRKHDIKIPVDIFKSMLV